MFKVLIVDDSKVILKISANLIKHVCSECDVITAENGKEAMILFDDTIDLVMTDWNMPVMNGYQLVQKIRETSKVPIWMITTEGGRDEVIKALRAGVNNYIVKPMDKDIITTKLRDFMNSHPKNN